MGRLTVYWGCVAQQSEGKRMTTALVTGGTGFVGAHVARALVDAGIQVRILRRSTSRLDLVHDIDCEHAVGDVLDPDSLRTLWRERMRRDFDAGRTVVLGGWVVSETEARLWAWQALREGG